MSANNLAWVNSHRESKQYMGGGVCAEFDDYALVLTTTTEDGVTNRIVLEPKVWHALEEYVTRAILKAALPRSRSDD